jgi:spore maturation protein CgeB
MKIALLGSKDFDSLEYHLHDSLIFLGHDVFHIDIKDVIKIPYKYNYWATKLFPKYDIYIFDKIANLIIEQKPEIVIATYRFIHPECIQKIKKVIPCIPVIHVNPDALTTFEYQQIFASPYDAYFTKDPYIVDFMKNKMGLNAHYLPEALNPRVHKSPQVNRMELEKSIGIDVVAFGTMYPYRAKMVYELIMREIDVTLFGVPDRRFPNEEISKRFRNEFITGNRKAEVLYGSKIVFNNFHYAEIESANVKYFEISGIGGFQICDYKPTLEEYSKVDVKKYTYRTIDEAIDLIKYYLPRTEERHQMAKEQMEYFHQNHTYEHRVNQIINTVF